VPTETSALRDPTAHPDGGPPSEDRERGPRSRTGGYLTVMSVYGVATAVGAGLVRARKPDAFRDFTGVGELIAIGAAVHKATRLISKDSVTTPIREPFTEFDSSAGPSEVNDVPRGRGLRHVVGELISCPFCLDVWTATAVVLGRELLPRTTRAAVTVLDAVAIADALQFAYVGLEHATE
jgi:hypothetical protein